MQTPGPAHPSPLFDPNTPALLEARKLWSLNHFDAALTAFSRAADAHPPNVAALLDAARAHGARYHVSHAVRLLDRARALAGDDPNLLHLIAQSYRISHREPQAAELFRQVVDVSGEIPDAYLEMALILERRHHLAEAAALIEACLKRFPDYLAPRLLQARLARRQNRVDAALQILRDIALNPEADDELRTRAWADTAEIEDAQGDFSGAMRSIAQGKSIQASHALTVRKLSDFLTQHFTRLALSVTRRDFARWTDRLSGIVPLRTALLTGFPRSGTTLLEQVLDAHPGICSSEELEIFSRDIFSRLWRQPGVPFPTVELLNKVSRPTWLDARRQYFDRVEDVAGHGVAERWHVDKNPTLTLLIPAFRRLFPEAAILIALRDPRDVVLSCYLRYLPLNTHSVCFLTLEQCARRYANDMGVWLKLRDILPQPWLEVRYKDVVAQVEREARRCVQLLSLPWDEQILNYRQRLAEKKVNSPSYEAVSKPIYTSALARHRNYAAYLEPVLPILAPFINAFGYA